MMSVNKALLADPLANEMEELNASPKQLGTQSFDCYNRRPNRRRHAQTRIKIISGRFEL